MTRLLADENVPVRLVRELCRRGHDVLRVQDLGRVAIGMDDPDVLRTACSLQRAVLTENAWDFIRLHSRDPGHQGIIVFTRDTNVPALASRIEDKLDREGDLAGKVDPRTTPERSWVVKNARPWRRRTRRWATSRGPSAC